MAKSQQSGKSKRPRGDKAKLIAGRCYKRAQDRHLVNARLQLARYKHNLELITAGQLTAWGQACQARADRRAKTCVKCRVLFDEETGQCVNCGGTANLASRHR